VNWELRSSPLPEVTTGLTDKTSIKLFEEIKCSLRLLDEWPQKNGVTEWLSPGVVDRFLGKTGWVD